MVHRYNMPISYRYSRAKPILFANAVCCAGSFCVYALCVGDCRWNSICISKPMWINFPCRLTLSQIVCARARARPFSCSVRFDVFLIFNLWLSSLRVCACIFICHSFCFLNSHIVQRLCFFLVVLFIYNRKFRVSAERNRALTQNEPRTYISICCKRAYVLGVFYVVLCCVFFCSFARTPIWSFFRLLRVLKTKN